LKRKNFRGGRVSRRRTSGSGEATRGRNLKVVRELKEEEKIELFEG